MSGRQIAKRAGGEVGLPEWQVGCGGPSSTLAGGVGGMSNVLVPARLINTESDEPMIVTSKVFQQSGIFRYKANCHIYL